MMRVCSIASQRCLKALFLLGDILCCTIFFRLSHFDVLIECRPKHSDGGLPFSHSNVLAFFIHASSPLIYSVTRPQYRVDRPPHRHLTRPVHTSLPHASPSSQAPHPSPAALPYPPSPTKQTHGSLPLRKIIRKALILIPILPMRLTMLLQLQSIIPREFLLTEST